MVTPLNPKEFFQGTWRGEGELIPNAFLRWFAPREHFYLTSEAICLSDTIWIVNDRFQFPSGRILDRKMYCQLVAPSRIHVTADDMPLGADIVLSDSAFSFTPYYALVKHRGFMFRVRCFDQNTIDHEGYIHDIIRVYFAGVPVATMRIGPITRNHPRAA